VVPMPIRPRARRERGSGSGIEVDILKVPFFFDERKIEVEVDDEKDFEVMYVKGIRKILKPGSATKESYIIQLLRLVLKSRRLCFRGP
jgi:hypothetical protein